jgi:hypothetical protein
LIHLPPSNSLSPSNLLSIHCFPISLHQSLSFYQLFDSVTNSWNPLLIATTLNPLDAYDNARFHYTQKLIIVIVWKPSPQGNYTIKSAYMLLCMNLSSQDTSTHVCGDWKLIWSLKVAPKLKHLY